MLDEGGLSLAPHGAMSGMLFTALGLWQAAALAWEEAWSSKSGSCLTQFLEGSTHHGRP